MSFERLVSEDRESFVWRAYDEMDNKALVNTPDRENRKSYFLKLVKENEKLFEVEKQFCREKFTYDFELQNARDKWGEPRKCNRCKTTRYSDKYCEKCISLHLQSLFDTWTSGNEMIDNFIHQSQTRSSLPQHILEWIPFNQFKDVTKLTEGGFSSIYTATWTRGFLCDYNEREREFNYFGPQNVVLKCLNNSSVPGKTFFNEALDYCKIKSSHIVSCFGITKFSDNNNYAMVLNCHPEGNLRNHLQENRSKLTLKDRITILKHSCQSLYDIHEKDLIHGDLHSGNVLIEGNTCLITDLGLCGPADEESSSKICGIVPYTAPEVLQGKKAIKESDIYSIGMLMWEIFAGRPPFDDRAHDRHLISQICEGLRPQILPSMPDEYAQMMQKCWDADPSERPTIEELWGFADNKLEEIYKNGNLKTNTETKKDTAAILFKKWLKFTKNKKNKRKGIKEINFDNSNNTNFIGNSSNSNLLLLPLIHKTHPLAYHKSRILDDEIAKSKSLKK